MEYFIVFVFGIIVGSFLNVCIYRIPLSKSIVFPGSFCPFCEKPIKWYDNIPLVSFIVLRAKCRYCAKPIPARYFVVELLTGSLAVVLFYFYSFSAQFFAYSIFVCSLIVMSFIDVEYNEIPDVISIPGIVIGLILMTVLRLDGSDQFMKAFMNSLFGILIGGGSMFLLGVAGELIFRKEALGGGDVKLMAMIGAFLGWKLVLLTFFIAPVAGSGSALVAKIKFGKEVIAYGPYLSLGAVISMLCGNDILAYVFRF
ncbi:MAG: prepilin peptidase [Candidatus Omnitrophica bacterium]|nr:prepilin peptidase [Candidatus Omnitrophota bacterium]